MRWIAVLIILPSIALGEFYVVRAEASATTYEEAKDKAFKLALARLSEMIVSEVKTISTFEKEVSSEKGVKEVFKKKISVTSNLVIEGYNFKEVKRWEEKGEKWIEVELSISKKMAMNILRCFYALSLAESYKENGYLSSAFEELLCDCFKNTSYYRMRAEKMKVFITKIMENLRDDYERAVNFYKEGKFMSFLNISSKIIEIWRDFPYIDDLKSMVSEVIGNIDVKLKFGGDWLLIGSENPVDIAFYMFERPVKDSFYFTLKTPDEERTVEYTGATSTVLVKPNNISKVYRIGVIINGVEKTYMEFPVRIFPRYEITGCSVKTSKNDYSMLRVGEKVDVLLKAPVGMWFHVFDYDDRLKKSKLVLKRRMIRKGSLRFKISFDEPTEGFYEGIVVIFSKKELKDLKEGRMYSLSKIREILAEISEKAVEERYFIVTK